jgi:hypothetical protein
LLLELSKPQCTHHNGEASRAAKSTMSIWQKVGDDGSTQIEQVQN